MKKTMEKTMRQRWKQSDIRARADPSPGQIDTPHKQSPAAERRRARISVTRISTIAHLAAERTLKRKGARAIPAALSKNG
jgi:hypothetical protein